MNTQDLPTLVFMDVETTGLSPYCNDRICEIALLRLTPDGKTTHWQSLVNPERPISPEASAVNGISDDMLEHEPVFKSIAPAVVEFMQDAVLVCHNAPFDVSFLTSELARCSLAMPGIPVLDTLRIARRYFKFPSNALGNIATHLGIGVEGRHRALADVHTTRKIFCHFWKELKKMGITELDTLYFSAR